MRLLGAIIALLAAVLMIAAPLPGMAGEPKGPLVRPIDLLGTTSDSNPMRYQMMRYIVQSWKKLGIDAYMNPFKYEAMVKRAFRSKRFDTYIINWGSSLIRLDPNVFLYDHHHGSMAGWDGVNVSGWQSEEYDKLADEMRSEMDTAKRQKLAWKLQEILYEAQPDHSFLHQEFNRIYNKERFADPVTAPGAGTSSFWTNHSIRPLTDQRVLRIAAADDIKTLSPIMSQLFLEEFLLSHFYDLCFRIGPDAKPQPWACTDAEWPDPTHVVLTVRDGMKFHDGQPVTAEDVAFSFNYAKEKKASRLMGALQFMDKAEVIGPMKVKISLTKPDASFMLQGLSRVWIIPEHIWSKVDTPATFANRNPVGSGPFKFKHWRPSEELALDANKVHFSPPKIDGLIFAVYGSIDASMGSMERNEMDVHYQEIHPKQLHRFENLPFIEIVKTFAFGQYMVIFNNRVEPMNDKHFRRALSYAVPADVIVKRVLDGHALLAGAHIAPENKFWHNPNLPTWESSLDKAREELKKAGYEWDSKGRLHMPAPENDKRVFDSVDKYPKMPIDWGPGK